MRLDFLNAIFLICISSTLVFTQDTWVREIQLDEDDAIYFPYITNIDMFGDEVFVTVNYSTRDEVDLFKLTDTGQNFNEISLEGQEGIDIRSYFINGELYRVGANESFNTLVVKQNNLDGDLLSKYSYDLPQGYIQVEGNGIVKMDDSYVVLSTVYREEPPYDSQTELQSGIALYWLNNDFSLDTIQVIDEQNKLEEVSQNGFSDNSGNLVLPLHYKVNFGNAVEYYIRGFKMIRNTDKEVVRNYKLPSENWLFHDQVFSPTIDSFGNLIMRSDVVSVSGISPKLISIDTNNNISDVHIHSAPPTISRIGIVDINLMDKGSLFNVGYISVYFDFINRYGYPNTGYIEKVNKGESPELRKYFPKFREYKGYFNSINMTATSSINVATPIDSGGYLIGGLYDRLADNKYLVDLIIGKIDDDACITPQCEDFYFLGMAENPSMLDTSARWYGCGNRNDKVNTLVRFVDKVNENGLYKIKFYDPERPSTIYESTTFLRETKEGEVYWMKNEGNQKLLYTFNLEEGDFFVREAYEFPEGETDSILVEKVDSITLENGEKRKRMYMRCLKHNTHNTTTWIEGIGDIKGFMNTIKMCTDQYQYSNLYSFKIKDTTLYSRDILDNCKVSTSQVSFIDFKVTPNPVDNEFTIDYSGYVESINIYSLNGRKIKSFPNQSRYNISDLHPGLYFIELKSRAGSVGVKKIIVE